MTSLPLYPGELRRVGDQGLYVRQGGDPDADPAVFVHGLGGSSTNWAELMAALADRLHGHAVDLPGFGRSDPPPHGRYTLAAHAEAVTRLIDSLGSGPVHLFGNSLGGAVCTRVAARRPDAVRTLTLVSPAFPRFRPGDVDPRMLLLAVPGTARLMARRMAKVTPEQRALAVLDMCYFAPERMPPERRRDAVVEAARRATLPWSDAAFAGSLRGLIGSYGGPGRRGLWSEAAAVAAPVLLVWGRHDRLVPVAVADRAVRTFPDARLVVFEDVGHVSQMEKPEETAAAVRRFLDDSRRR